MKILLDENIDVRFKYLFDNISHKVLTVRDMNWLGVKNGELMQLNQFDIFIAVDKNLPFQQSLRALPVLVIILDVKRNVLSRLEALYPSILANISEPIKRGIVILAES
ncbi:MAG TPA: DUF5615 family PIN-like protein [Chitinophagaceae bacterium]|nr:DUF5615 family PIN-like protein [Chitinophagaceae bacterium]